MLNPNQFYFFAESAAKEGFEALGSAVKDSFNDTVEKIVPDAMKPHEKESQADRQRKHDEKIRRDTEKILNDNE